MVFIDVHVVLIICILSWRAVVLTQCDFLSALKVKVRPEQFLNLRRYPNISTSAVGHVRVPAAFGAVQDMFLLPLVLLLSG